jgi:hypothetical protein
MSTITELPAFDELEPEISPAAALQLHPGLSATCPECDLEINAKTQMGLNRSLGRHRSIKHGVKGVQQKAKDQKAPRNPDESPTENKRRKSGSEILALVASGLGSLVSLSSPAAGLALKLEAPLVGPAADKAISGTVVDRLVLQKALAAKGKFDAIGPLIAFPILVGICEKNPAMRPQLYGPLRMCITPMLADLVKAMQKQAADNEKLSKAAADLSNLDPGFAALFANGVDPVDAILGTLFPPEEPDEDNDSPGS